MAMQKRCECLICFRPYDLRERLPRVLQCGHTCSHACLSCLATPIRCPTCRQHDKRPVSDLPRNYELVDAARLDLSELLNGISVSSADASADPTQPLQRIQRIWLDGCDLQLSEVELGRGATSRVVEGTYQGRQVSPQSTAHELC